MVKFITGEGKLVKNILLDSLKDVALEWVVELLRLSLYYLAIY